MNAVPATLADLCERYWRFQCDEFPLTAIMASQPVTHDDLLREAPSDHERRAHSARTLLAELAAIDPERLDIAGRASYRLLERELHILIDSVALWGHLRPAIFPCGPDFFLNYVAGTVTLQNEADAARWCARLLRIPAGLQGVQDALAAGASAGLRTPRLVVERLAAQLAGQLGTPPARSALYGPYARAADRFEARATKALNAIEHMVYPALRAYAAFVADTLGTHARDSLSCADDVHGEAFYRLQIRLHTGQDIDPALVHRLGLDEVERIGAQMDSVALDAGFAGDLAGYIRQLKDDPGQFATSAGHLQEQIEILSKRIDAKLPEFFGRLPRSTYGVKLMASETASGAPPAYAQPNPADNSAAGVHWVNPLPHKCPRYLHLPIALHEAWPGHLMHTALIQEQTHLPAFRRYGALRYAACLEGWALYCENMGVEMGLYDTPDKRYGLLEMEMWRALRLVVDSGIHALGWGREQAIDLMLQHLALPRATIEAEVDRYIAWPGQALAYQIGNLKFRALRQRSEARLGERFDRRAFHDALMAAGPVTLDALDEYIEAWIGAAAAHAFP